MKSIGFISALLHAVFFSAVVKIGSQQSRPLAPPAEVRVMEMMLGSAPRLATPPSAGRKTAPAAAKRIAVLTPPVPPATAFPELHTSPVATPNVAAGATNAAVGEKMIVATGKGVAMAASGSGIGSTSGMNAGAGSVAGASHQPYLISSPPPIYPGEARHKGWSGNVRVRVLISEEGSVREVQLAASSGYPSLDAAALEALRHWLFRPAQIDGRAVAAWVVVPVRFRLD
jgi:periplasmic protein TonB